MRNFMAAANKSNLTPKPCLGAADPPNFYFGELSTTIQFHSGQFSSGVVSPSSPKFALDDLARLN